MPGSDKGEGDLFFDSVEHLYSEEELSAVETETSSCGSRHYDIWMNEPRSVKERRENFFMEMGFTEFSFPVFGADRLSEVGSGAVSSTCSSITNSIEETSSSCGREVDDDDSYANLMIDELDEHPGNSISSVSMITAGENYGINKKKIHRWWSFLKNRRNPDNINGSRRGFTSPESPSSPRLKVRNNKKQWMEFAGFYAAQEIQAHSGIIWSMKFSPDGQFLASGGEDGIVRIWRVKSLNARFDSWAGDSCSNVTKNKFGLGSRRKNLAGDPVVMPDKIFWVDELPLQEFHGHNGDILDLAWSSSNYLLSASNDKTVRLWRVDCDRCLNVFHHNDYVTCVQFNPANENYFISGSIDGKVRVWGVSEKRVVDWANVRDVITAICYQPDGKGFVVGSIIGTCYFFNASGTHLELDATVQIQGRAKTYNKKITSIQFSRESSQRVMITSEDGKIRILEGLEVVHKYRGRPKSGSQLTASFTPSGKHIVSVGEDSRVYLWNYDGSFSPSSRTMKSVRSCEHFFSEAVSVAVPWSGMGTEWDNMGIRSSSRLCNTSRGIEPVQAVPDCRDTDWSCLGNWFSMEGRCIGSATWPEEKLTQLDLPSQEECNFQPNHPGDDRPAFTEPWGLVVVTASLDGKIRAFHNYGLPVRL